MLSATGLADDSYAINTQGVRLDAAGELAEALSGIKTVRPVIKDSLRFRAYEASSQIGSSSKLFLIKLPQQRGKVDAARNN